MTIITVEDALPTTTERFQDLVRCDAQLQAMVPSAAVWAAAAAEEGPFERRLDVILAGYADRPAIGERTRRVETDPSTGTTTRRPLPGWDLTTYGEIRDRARAIAMAWREVPGLTVGRDELVAIFGFAGADFTSLDLACAYAQAVTVPLQATTSSADLDGVFDRIEPTAVAASIGDLLVAAGHAVRQSSVRSLIAFDHDPSADDERARWDAARELLDAAGSRIQLVTFEDVVAAGRDRSFTFLEPHPAGRDRLALIMHSSGATGSPKGAMFHEGAVASHWDAGHDVAPQVTVQLAPLTHGMGHVLLHRQMRGGCLTFVTLRPDLSTLFEDIRLARPTLLVFFPRVLDLIHQHFAGEVERRTRAGEPATSAREAVMAEMRGSFLGDRLLFAIVGSAPTSAQVKRFVVECFDIELAEGYANTETGAGSVTTDNVVDRSTVVDFRLRDVPELGYSTKDVPYPRGELCFKSVHQVRGYYRDPEATAALTTEDGYVVTGDVVEQRGPDEIVLIDRRKDVLKLSQAEYVAVGPLGVLFEAGSPVVLQMYLYGSSHRSYLLAVVVPDAEVVEAEIGPDAGDEEVRELVRRELRRVATERGLKTFEVPRDVILEWEPFTQENGLLSSVRKLLRPALQRRYGDRLEAIYDAHDRALAVELSEVQDPACRLPVPQRLARLVAIHLGLEHVDPDAPLAYGELGGDSLGAVELSRLIADTFGVDVPADRILGPTGTVPSLAAEIAAQISEASARPTFARVHGAGATVLHAKDLALDRFLDTELLAAAAGLPVADGPPRVVLVTGANGFLGREVCLQWMERVAPLGGRVVCLVRAADDAAARDRLTRSYAEVSDAYLARFEALAKDHLEVLAGDVAEPALGLDAATHARLAAEVDRISHGAALVNHRLGYAHLFAPNVAGTAEIVRLACTTRRIPVDAVSTLGVLPLLDRTAADDESAPPAPSVPLVDDEYAGGYAVSKWASEHLLQQAAAELALPVTILRGPMMLPHREVVGVINASDMFTRLLFSVAVTGLAPRSFYRPAANGRLAAGHYDGIPVDVVAAAVVAAADLPSDGCCAVNMSNHHVDDGASLDAVVDWIESAGYDLERLEDYANWLARFRAALDALPAERRAASALDVLGAYARPQERAHVVTTTRFRELVSRLDDGDVPHLDEAYLHKCLADLRHLHLLHEVTPT